MMDCSNTKSRMPNFMRGVAVQVVGESRVRHHITLLVFAVIYCVVITVVRSSYEFASDYAINSTAAVAGARGVSLYDRETLRHLAVERIGAEKTRGLFSGTYSSFIGLPSTAWVYLPFTAFHFEVGLWMYRVVAWIAMVGSIIIASRALPQEDRADAILRAGLVLLTSYATHSSLQLGQVDAWIMIGIALAVWGVSKQRWGLAGIGIALAALLKVSPIVIAIYLLMRGKWQTAVATAVSILAILFAMVIMGSGNDTIIFITAIAPVVGQGTLLNQNQSAVAWIGRMASPQTDFVFSSPPIDLAFLIAGMIVLATIMIGLWAMRWKADVDPSEISVVLIASLLTAPITWDHYMTWAVLGLIPLMRRRAWRILDKRSATAIAALIALGAILIIMPPVAFLPDTLWQQGWMRFATGSMTIGLIAWLAAGWQLAQTSAVTIETTRLIAHNLLGESE